MSGLEYDKGDDTMKWKDIVLNNEKDLHKHKIDLDKMILANDSLVQDYPELPKVNIYLNMDGEERIRVANGYQNDLYGGGFYAFDVAVNPKEFILYGMSAPSVIANKAMIKYMKIIRK